MEHRTEKEIERRISIVWNKFWALKHILKGPFKNYSKSMIFSSCILPTITYGSQTWAPTKKTENKLRVTQNKMERSILGIKLRDKIRIKEIKNKLPHNLDFVMAARRRKWDWAGHVRSVYNTNSSTLCMC